MVQSKGRLHQTRHIFINIILKYSYPLTGIPLVITFESLFCVVLYYVTLVCMLLSLFCVCIRLGIPIEFGGNHQCGIILRVCGECSSQL